MALPQLLDYFSAVSFLLLLLPFCLFFLFGNRFRSTSLADRPNLPPSPFKLPIIGNLHQLGLFPHRSLRDLAAKHGPLMFLHLGQSPTLVVSSAKVVQEIVNTYDLAFSGRPSLKAAYQLLYGRNDVAFSPYGEYWRGMKKVCVVELLSTRRVQSFRPVMEEEISIMIKNISDRCSKKAPVNLTEMLMDLTNNIITRVAFGTKFGGTGENKCAGLTRELLILLGEFCVGDFFPSLGWIDVVTGLDRRMKRNFRELDAVMNQIIEDHLNLQREEKNTAKDFVDVLLQVQRERNPQEVPLSKENLKAIILDMFAGGTETTSTGLDWAMAELIKNPRIMMKAQEEVRRVVGGKAKIEEEEIQEMNYLKSIVKETLRLHPPICMNFRETMSASQLKGYDIPPKTKVIINLWAVARDPDYWENAEEFFPERFINNPVDFKGKDFHFIPFGMGRRGCPGVQFGTFSMELTLANLLYWFDWQLPGGEKDLDMAEGSGISVRRKCHLHLVPISKFA